MNFEQNLRKNEKIDEICELLRLSWKDFPELRLGQFLSIIGGSCDLFHVLDEKMENTLREVLISGNLPSPGGTSEHSKAISYYEYANLLVSNGINDIPTPEEYHDQISKAVQT